MSTTPKLGLPLNLRGHIPMQISVRKAFEILDEKFGIPALSAGKSGTFSGTGTEDDTITIGEIVYVLKDVPAEPYEVDVGSTAAETATNLFEAINGDLAGTDAHPDVSAANPSAGVVAVTARVAGAAGNEILLAESGTGFSWADDAVLLSGGADISDTAAALVILQEAFADLILVPTFDDIADEGKVLKIVAGVLAWADDETSA